jgi:hypothetical protein
MGRKKRLAVVLKPFCYYCDKEFNNEIILHQHQKARHFNCKICRKRFSTAPALDTHVLQTHKEKLTRVPNAKAERDSFDISIFGMDGVPLELINVKLAMKVSQKRKRLIQENRIVAEEEDLKEMRKKKKDAGKKTKEFDIKAMTQQGAAFYHNPDSINLTLNKNQMNSMFNKNQMNALYPPGSGLGDMNNSGMGYPGMPGMPGQMGMHDPKMFMNFMPPQGQMPNHLMGIAPIPIGQIRPGFQMPGPYPHQGNLYFPIFIFI